VSKWYVVENTIPISKTLESYVQINMIDTKLLQARVQRSRDISNIRQNFRHDVEFLAGDAGLLDSRSQLSLGLVHFGAVEVVVVETDGGFGAVDAGLVELGLVAGLVPGCAGAVA
jgi:hypothetical protein